MTTMIDYDPEGTAIRLPDGRTVHVWHHDCDTCTSLDVWTTTPGEPEHRITLNGEHRRTGDETRAPFGLFTFAGGSRFETTGGGDVMPETYKRSAQTTAVLIWKDAPR